jgi:hypothetical protein
MNIGNIAFPFEVGIQPTDNASELRQPDHANIDNFGKLEKPNKAWQVASRFFCQARTDSHRAS